MLILTRKLGESVIIGDNIVIRVVELRRSRVRIGIEAPEDVRILRGEHLLRSECRPDERADAEHSFVIQLPIGATDDLSIGNDCLLESATVID
jgi:carbon storage regulator CsrA